MSVSEIVIRTDKLCSMKQPYCSYWSCKICTMERFSVEYHLFFFPCW